MQGGPAATPPGPTARWWGLPLLRAMARDYLGFTRALQRQHGDITCMRIGPERAYDLFDPALVRQALVDHADHLVRWERGMQIFAQAFGQSVLVTEGATWQRQRRMLAPGFSPRRVQGYATLMTDAAATALDTAVPAGASEAVVDMGTLLDRLTMDVILRTLFSQPAGTAMAADAGRATQVLSHSAMREMFWPVTLPDWLPLPGKAAKRWGLRTLHGLVRQQIAQRLALPAGTAPQQDLLAMLLAARDDSAEPPAAGCAPGGAAQPGAALSSTEVHDQCMVMFQAGHETSATALLWWCWLMASHPAAQQRARQEVQAVLGGRLPGPADLPALDWLGASLKEAMRLHPPVGGLMSRRVRQPLQLGGYTVPAGALLRITPAVIHRDARWFPQPDAFLPGRFTAGAPPLPRGAWMPFCTGPRVCIGQHFAQMEMTLVAAMLLQRHALHTVPGDAAPEPDFQVTLRPRGPLRLRLVRQPTV